MKPRKYIYKTLRFSFLICRQIALFMRNKIAYLEHLVLHNLRLKAVKQGRNMTKGKLRLRIILQGTIQCCFTVSTERLFVNSLNNDSRSLLENKINTVNELFKIMASKQPQKQTGAYIEVSSISQLPSCTSNKQIPSCDLLSVTIATTALFTSLAQLINSLKSKS